MSGREENDEHPRADHRAGDNGGGVPQPEPAHELVLWQAADPWWLAAVRRAEASLGRSAIGDSAISKTTLTGRLRHAAWG